MNIICNPKYAYHYYRDNILIYKTLHEFDVLPQLYSDIVELISKQSLDYISLYSKLCEKYEVETEDIAIKNAFSNVMNKLIDAGYICEEEDFIPKVITGEKGLCYPFSIIVEITDKCNLMCKHCYREAKHYNYTEMEYSDFEDICKLFKGKTPNIVLTGGEITTNKNIVGIIKESANFFNIYILSNGIALSEIPIAELKKVSFAQISLYGYNEASFYEFTNVRNGLVNFENGIRTIQKAGIDYIVTLMITADNKLFIEKYIRYLVYLNVKKIAFGINSPVGRVCKSNRNMFLSDLDRKYVSEELRRLEIKYTDRIRFMPYSSIESLKIEARDIMKDYVDFSCSAGKSNVVIDPHGNIRPCHMMPASLFSEYNFRDYVLDLNNGNERNYKKEILDFGKFLKSNNHSYEDMHCVGFCNM